MSLKNIFNLFLLLFILNKSLILLADENWLKAFNAVENCDFAVARSYLEQQLNKGYGSYRFLGALLEKNKEYPQALVAYRRAQKEVGIKTFFDAISNIKRVKESLGHEVNVFYEYSVTLLFLIWGLFFQIIFLLGLFLFSKLLRSKQDFFLSFILALSFCSFGIIGYCIMKKFERKDQAVVIKEGLLRIGPDSFYQERELLKVGKEVMFLQKNDVNNWYKVVSNGVLGWVSGDVLEKI